MNDGRSSNRRHRAPWNRLRTLFRDGEVLVVCGASAIAFHCSPDGFRVVENEPKDPPEGGGGETFAPGQGGETSTGGMGGSQNSGAGGQVEKDMACCDDGLLNGTETDVDCGGEACGPCDLGQACKKTRDCDPAETGTATGAICGEHNTCALLCEPEQSDCNGLVADGCETLWSTDPVRCGGCLASDPNPGDGQSCRSYMHAIPSCDGSQCFWECEMGWEDLDDDLGSLDSNGCEQQQHPLCESSYVEGTFYVPGSLVSHLGKNWECALPECRQLECTPGTPCAWGQTWDDLGLCAPENAQPGPPVAARTPESNGAK